MTHAPGEDPVVDRGSVVAVRESVVGMCDFPERLPDLLHRLEAGPDGDVVLEVVAHSVPMSSLAIALAPPQGCSAGAGRDSGTSLRVPVGEALLGRMLDVFGETMTTSASPWGRCPGGDRSGRRSLMEQSARRRSSRRASR